MKIVFFIRIFLLFSIFNFLLYSQQVEIVNNNNLKKIISMADLAKDEEEKKIQESILNPDKNINNLNNKSIDNNSIHLKEYLNPWKDLDQSEVLMLNLENQDLSELLNILSKELNVTFITDDTVSPTRAPDLVPVSNVKISFKSQVPLNLKQLWELGITFLEMSGFSVIPLESQKRTYRVTSYKAANREPLPTFLGVDKDLLPDDDMKIRYIYFLENADINSVVQVIQAMKSASSSDILTFPQLRAVIMTDKSSNIKSILKIIDELDKVSVPETLAIIRLKHTDAKKVADLYNQLIGQVGENPLAAKKSTSLKYFNESTRVFAEDRTNSLIVLGTKDNIDKFKDFIVRYIDKTVDIPFSPLHVLQIKYIDSDALANILNDIIKKFNSNPENAAAAAFGGIRDGDKFFKNSISITSEPFSNKIIINSDYESFIKIKEIVEKLDVEQPQVAMKVLVLDVNLTNQEQLGVQLRNMQQGCATTGGTTNSLLGNNVNFQSAMLGGIQSDNNAGTTGAVRLLGNLISLLNLQPGGVSPFPQGSTLVTLGQDMYGFWGILAALQSFTRTSVIANPFLVTTHKYRAEIKVGTTLRVTSSIVEGARSSEAFKDLEANLRLLITPQISYDNMITLNTYVELTQFTNNLGNRTIKKVSTEALVSNNEVLALGGLIRDTINETEYRIPILGDIPLIGWLFKNKVKLVEKTSLLILICPTILPVNNPKVAHDFTFAKINESKTVLYDMQNSANQKDPIHKWMFKDNEIPESTTIDKFVNRQKRYAAIAKRSDFDEDSSGYKIKNDIINANQDIIDDDKKRKIKDKLKDKKMVNKKRILDMIKKKDGLDINKNIKT